MELGEHLVVFPIIKNRKPSVSNAFLENNGMKISGNLFEIGIKMTSMSKTVVLSMTYVCNEIWVMPLIISNIFLITEEDNNIKNSQRR